MSILHALTMILFLAWASAIKRLTWVPVKLDGQPTGDGYFKSRPGILYTRCNSITAEIFEMAFGEVEEILRVTMERMDTILEAIAGDETRNSTNRPQSKAISAVRTYSAFINPDLTGTTSAGPENPASRQRRLSGVRFFRLVASNVKNALANEEPLQISCHDSWAAPFYEPLTRAPKTQRTSQSPLSETQSDDRRSKPQPGPGWSYDSRSSLEATGAYNDPNNKWIKTYFRPWRRWPFPRVMTTWWPPVFPGEEAQDPPDLGLLSPTGPLWPAVLLQRMRGAFPTVIDIAPMYINGWKTYPRTDSAGRAKWQPGMGSLRYRYYSQPKETLKYYRVRSSRSAETVTQHAADDSLRPHLLQYNVWLFPPLLLLTNLVQANKFAGFNMTRRQRYGQCSDLPDCPIALSYDTHLLFEIEAKPGNHAAKDVQYGNFSRFLLDAKSNGDMFTTKSGMITAGAERFVLLALALYLDGSDWSTGLKGGPWFSPGPAYLGPPAEANDRSRPPNPGEDIWEELQPQGPYPPPFIPEEELNC